MAILLSLTLELRTLSEAGGPLITEETAFILPDAGEVSIKAKAYFICLLDHIAGVCGMGRSLYVFLTTHRWSMAWGSRCCIR